LREAQNREMLVSMEMNYDDSAYPADDSRPLEELLFGNPMDPIELAIVQLGHGSMLLSAGAGLALIWRTAEDRESSRSDTWRLTCWLGAPDGEWAGGGAGELHNQLAAALATLRWAMTQECQN
jgi:hypothetical protein